MQLHFNTVRVIAPRLAFLSLALLTACGVEPGVAPAHGAKLPDSVQRVGSIRHPRLTESSGLAASRRFPGVFWTHNDGGGKRQVLYAMRRNGEHIGEFRVVKAAIEDWEDLAGDGEGHLFLADTGNNNLNRRQVAVYQIDEPDIADPKVSVAAVTRGWQLLFPGSPLDCESLFVWRNYGYLISKVVDDARAEIYRFALTEQKTPATLEFVAQLQIESPVAGADISPDGAVLGIVAKSGAFACRIEGDVARAGQRKPEHTRFKRDGIEGCAFVPEGLLATSESRDIFLFTNPAFIIPPTPR